MEAGETCQRVYPAECEVTSSTADLQGPQIENKSSFPLDNAVKEKYSKTITYKGILRNGKHLQLP